MLILRQLKQFYNDHIDPDGIQPIQAIRTTVAGILAIIIYHAFDWSQAYWIVVSAILIIQTYNPSNLNHRWAYLLISGISATVLTFIAGFLGKFTFILALFLGLTTFIAVYLNAISIDVWTAAFYVNVFCLSAGALPVTGIQSAERTLSVFIGFLIAVIVCLFLFPESLSFRIRRSLSHILSRLADFNQVLLERPDDLQKISVFRNRLMRGFNTARQTLPSQEIQFWQILEQSEYIYEIILMLNEIKQQAEKQKILKIVNKELSILLNRLTFVLKSFSRSVQTRKPPLSLRKFIKTLNVLEKYYSRHVNKLNETQFLGFTVYIEGLHKLQAHTNFLKILIKTLRYKP